MTIAFPPRRCGWSHHAYHLSRHQVRLGHQVRVFHPQPVDEERSSQEVDDIRVDLGPFASRWGSSPGRLLFAGLAAAEIMRGHAAAPFHLIHLHGDVQEALVLLPLARRLGLPLVMTVHSGLNRRPRYQRVASWIWPRIDGVLAVSPDIATDIVALGGDPKRITILSSGVDLERFAPVTGPARDRVRAELNIRARAFVVVALGRLVPTKGFDVLISALPHLSGLPELEVYIVGDGPLRGPLEALAAGHRNVHLIGDRPQETVVQFLQSADVFVLPLVDEPGVIEGTPTAVLEAMATALPVVTTNSGGAKYAIEGLPGVAGLPQRDPCAIAAAIRMMHRDRILRERIGAANRDRVEARSWPNVSLRVDEFYADVLGWRSELSGVETSAEPITSVPP